jgi:hypothetical protein
VAKKISGITQTLFLAWGLSLLGLAVFFHLNTGEWKDAFFYDGDNITLGLALKSMINGEPFNWIFSSQSFIFPEAPLFIASYAVTRNFYSALLLNSYFNILLIVSSAFVLAIRIYSERTRAVLAAVLFLIFLIASFNLENKPDINSTTLLTLILFTTYYVGVIGTSLAVVLLYDFALSFGVKSHHTIYTALIIFASSFALASNPLFLLQFIAPCLLLGTVLFTFNYFRHESKFLLFTCITATGLGFAIRVLLSSYTAASVKSYISLDRINNAFVALSQTLQKGAEDTSISLLWLLWAFLFVFHLVAFAKNLNNDKKSLSFTYVFIHAFCILSPIITLAGVLLTGNHLTRYLLPVPFYTLLGSALIVPTAFKKPIKPYFAATVLIIGTMLTYQSYSGMSYKVPNAVSNIRCFSNFANTTEFNFIGSFPTSRYLNLYSEYTGSIYQVNKEFYPINWLSNKYDHSTDQIGYVIADKRNDPALLNHEDTNILGNPDAVHECLDFNIYTYNAESHGHKILNERIRN